MTLQERALARALRFRLRLSLEKLAPLIECAKIDHKPMSYGLRFLNFDPWLSHAEYESMRATD